MSDETSVNESNEAPAETVEPNESAAPQAEDATAEDVSGDE